MMQATLLLALLAASTAEQYTFDFGSKSLVGDNVILTRQLQLGAGCYFQGPKVGCEYSFETTGENHTATTVVFTAICDNDSQTAFDIRKAANCGCQAEVYYPGSPVKICPCTVCPEGFGDSPVNVDCSMYENQANETATVGDTSNSVKDSVTIPDNRRAEETLVNPYIVSSCTSLDCSSSCNGTCALNCANSGTACKFCSNADGNQPTASPTGGSGNDIKNFGDSSSAGLTSALVSLVLVVMLLVVLLVA